MESNTQILVQQVDGTNGVIITDPNAVIKDGKVYPRYVAHEDLMIYVEVRAFTNAKAKFLDFSQTDYEVINITRGVFYSSANAKKDQNSQKRTFTTDWTNMFDENKPLDIEGFGINSIDIEFNASLVPSIHIEFIDIRGKNLLERADDPLNPYNAFYLFPYPMFELVVKGYFGKAIRMPLIMEKAITKFDPSTGSYIISADLKSWTFAILNDLILLYAMITPFMYKEDNGRYLGERIIEEKYDTYFRNANISGTDRTIPLWKMFTLNTIVSKIIKSGVGEKIITRNSLVDQLTASLNSFRDQVAVLAEKENKNKYQLDLIVGETLISMQGACQTLSKLGYSEATNWPVATVIKTDNYWKDEDKNGVKDGIFEIIPMTDELYKQLSDPISKFNTEKLLSEVDELRSQFRGKLEFEPSIRNVIITTVVHLDAFMELLRQKSEKIFTDIVNANPSKLSAFENDYEVVEVENGKYRRLPWCEYYEPDKTQKNEFIKGYPGASSNPTVAKWGEVEFIDEMYKATEKMSEQLNLAFSEALGYDNTFLVSPLLIPINPNLSSLNRTMEEIVNVLVAQILMMEFHNGLLYRQTDDSIRRDAKGVFEYFVKNLVDYFFPSDNLPPNFFTIFGLLQSKLQSLTDVAAFKKYVSDNIDGINKVVLAAFKGQDNKIVAPHNYSIPSKWLPTDDGNIKKYFQTLNKTGGATTYQMSPMGTSYHPKALEVLDLFQFDTITKTPPTGDGQEVQALFFTNKYADDDLFITRK